MGLLEISQVAPGTADFRDSGEAATKVSWGLGCQLAGMGCKVLTPKTLRLVGKFSFFLGDTWRYIFVHGPFFIDISCFLIIVHSVNSGG